MDEFEEDSDDPIQMEMDELPGFNAPPKQPKLDRSPTKLLAAENDFAKDFRPGGANVSVNDITISSNEEEQNLLNLINFAD